MKKKKLNKKTLFTGMVASSLLSACVSKSYLPAIYANDVVDMAKPHSTDSCKHAVYVQANGFFAHNPQILLIGSQPYNNDGGFLTVYHADTFSYLNIAYGVSGFGGDYNTTHYKAQPVSKSYYGFGLNASASLFDVSSPHVDFRYLGLDMVYSKEFGDYAAFRRQGDPSGDTYFQQSTLFSYGVFTEVCIKGKNSVLTDVKFSLHYTPSINSDFLNNSTFNTINLSVSQGYDRFLINFKASFGVSNTSNGNGPQLGVAYKLSAK